MRQNRFQITMFADLDVFGYAEMNSEQPQETEILSSPLGFSSFLNNDMFPSADLELRRPTHDDIDLPISMDIYPPEVYNVMERACISECVPLVSKTTKKRSKSALRKWKIAMSFPNADTQALSRTCIKTAAMQPFNESNLLLSIELSVKMLNNVYKERASEMLHQESPCTPVESRMNVSDFSSFGDETLSIEFP